MIVTILGSLNYDLVTVSDKIPGPGETISADKFELHHGGKGGNQCRAVQNLSLSDVKVRMIGRVGDDVFGQDILKNLRDSGIDISKVEVIKQTSSGVATIIVDKKSAENRILVFPGANGTWKKAPDSFKVEDDSGPQMLILQNEIPLNVVYDALKTAHDEGLITVYNPSPMHEETPLEVYAQVDYLLLNTTEADVLASKLTSGSWTPIDNDENRAKTALKLLSKHLSETTEIIITLGKNGYIYSPGIKGQAGKPPGPLVDTTGAGDTFLGAFASKIVRDRNDIAGALELAAKASAIAVTRAGAAESIPFLSELS